MNGNYGHGDGSNIGCCSLRKQGAKKRQIWGLELVIWEARVDSFLSKHDQLERDHQTKLHHIEPF